MQVVLAPLLQALPELGKDLAVADGIDCHGVPLCVLEPKWPDYTAAADSAPRGALLAVEGTLGDLLRCRSCPESVVLAIHTSVKMKMGFIAEPDVVNERCRSLALA